jgi:hypothetical protein
LVPLYNTNMDKTDANPADIITPALVNKSRLNT